MNAIEIKPAVREKTNILVSLAGPSGCGKTYSALLLARGLVGPHGKIGFIDTEAKRARHYSDLTPFDVADLAPPFSPLRYLEHVRAFAEAGYKALVIDSISHEWEGTGGCIEMAEGGKGLLAWQKPKTQHKKLMNYLLQVPMHVIFCARAREKMVQVNNPQTGKDEIINQGWQAIAEKNFIFEMTVSLLLDEKTKIPTLTKCPAQLVHAFPKGERITADAGSALREWAEQGAEVDLAFEALKADGREVAMLGTEELRLWFKGLSKHDRAKIAGGAVGELQSIADEADRNAAPADDDPFLSVTGINRGPDEPEDPPMPSEDEGERKQDDEGGQTNDLAQANEMTDEEIEAAMSYVGKSVADIHGFKAAKPLINWFNTTFKEGAEKHRLSKGQIESVARARDTKLGTFR